MVNASNPTHPWPHTLPLNTSPLLSFYAHHLSLYSDLRSFTEQRAQLEREYGTKLKAMVGKLREKELQGRKVVLLTVGEESGKGWEEGLERRNTLLTSLSTHLLTLETISLEHLRLADHLQSQIIDEYRKSGERKEMGRRKVQGWVEGVEGERERVGGEVGRAMGKYHQTTTDLHTARTKHARTPRDDKHLPRLLKSYKSALVEKNNARNAYVIGLGVGRRVGEVYSDRTERVGQGERGGEEEGEEGEEEPLSFGPGIARCQAELQTLFHSSTLRLNELLSHTSTVYSHFYTAQSQYAGSIVQAHEKVDPGKDADLYAEWNGNLNLKVDSASGLKEKETMRMEWEPCPGHVEEEAITLGGRDSLGFDEPGGSAGLGPAPALAGNSLNIQGKGEEVVVLQNRLAGSRADRTRLIPLIKGWKSEVVRARGVIKAYEGNRGLGDPDEVVEAMIGTLKDLSLAEIKVEALDVEIRLLEEALGDDQGAQKPHEFKNASFAIPTPCEYCKSSIWGITKPGSTCRKCGSNVHVKCANKVPAECTGGSASTIVPNKRMSYMFPRKDSSTSQSISDLASITSTKDKDKEESSLRAIRRSFTSRLHSSDSSVVPGSSPMSSPPVLPPPHKMTDMDNLDTTGIVGMPNGSRLHQSASRPVLTSPIQREVGTGRRISMFGSPTGGVVSPGGTPMRRRSGDMLGGPRASPGGSPAIEEEVMGLDLGYRMNGARSLDPSPSGTPGGLARARVLFDFEAADDDELTVEKGALVHVLEPDDGQGWIKVRLDVQGDSLEGLIPAGYVEMSSTPLMASQYRPQGSNLVSPVVSPATQPVTAHASPVSSPPNAAGFPFSPPAMPGGYSPASTPPTSSVHSRPTIPAPGAFGQVTALYDYAAAESDEFGLKKGATYNLSRRGTAYDAGWWELSYDDGRTGIAPSNYLRRI